MADRFTVGLVQMACSGDPDDNLARARERVREAAGRGAQVVCLPELFRSRYFPQVEDQALFDLAEPLDGPTTRAMALLARELRIAIVASIFERRDAGVYHNTAVVLDADGSTAGVYRKMHIPDDPLYYEKFYFTPGDLGFSSFDVRAGRIAAQVCWDQWFPEGARLAALQGARILFYPTAIGWHPSERAEQGERQRDAWRTVQRGHAVANGIYVAAANRVGHEGERGAGLQFWGSSFVCDPFGAMLCEGSTDGEEVLLAECSVDRIEDVRRGWPFLRDRRVDAYQGLLKRFDRG
jgi:N-carbamoylputrescine amidase